ncbi:PREDICTED: protein kinase APK1A, chloroplastic-like [Nelumbo nucifera]|uniref:non-specific serine/threonine protein kinase n=2 Tax=Nelumbo nucifera TaxID=4432 RepID=A0A1U7ZX15_NELNU|nr:PREDICTED: protein kinase APK1A, chloroplastic-like [Nelumbo nucifera]XP_010253666.1 PREDICTED: protein kinase APK1A, chloroplastic-like [Nelumbo nucifera]XP_010253667.1 PREDICTED: protein kinase APK1A, chloroplastic-like [Nelumbo nucifera]XP_010253668.1 PREDICTED: protein kinase APK1A, chloroplastic-like [Nelumbo nucifera]XP_019052791.1 PREDICTED: protein kinase APK1A, chloroplastic-like [Nelumbo nucifera]DAD26171.1 TPA_asm: hypothetical protein HUJ06_027639 [Nelumbo nucifera]
MCCLRWPHLPLLIIIQLVGPSILNQKTYVVEAFHNFKSTVGDPQQLSSWVGRYPCLRQGSGVNSAHRLKEQAVISLLRGACPPCAHSGIINLSPCSWIFYPHHTSNSVRADLYRSRKIRITATVDGDISVPTFTPLRANHVKKPRKQRLAAIIGGSAGASLLVVVSVLLVFICLMRAKRIVRRTSETGSSVPSPLVELAREHCSPHIVASSLFEQQNIRQLSIVELKEATSNFSQSNIIGEGGFGLVYKGLLQDGSMIAIKRRFHDPSRYFVQEIENIGHVCHRHLVKLIGYCQEIHQQLLVYEYLPYGNIGNYLYDRDGFPIGKLDIQGRLSMALGAAKGLEYLHSMVPPFLHMHFRTSNVLVDENFVAKVSDFGLSRLLDESSRAGSSAAIDCFLDPELRLSPDFSERSDVYSFGVFLLELVSGREAFCRNLAESEQNLVSLAKDISDLNWLVDKTLRNGAEDAIQRMVNLALQCLGNSVRRPTMKRVVRELEVIQERVMGHQHADMVEDIGVVTLGSELFK